MVQFFEKQKVDQIGIMSVALQKVLIFLMIVNMFSLFNAGGLLSFFLCLIGFVGAVKRRPCLLMVYFTISVIIMVIAFLVGMYVIVGLAFYVQDDQTHYNYTSGSAGSISDSSASAASAIHPAVEHAMRRLFSLASSSASSSSSSSSSDSFASGSFSFGSTTTDVFYTNSTAGFLLAFLFMILAFFLAYMKMFSLVLAWRLRKMILATPVLPTEYVAQPQDNSCAENEESYEMPQQPMSMNMSPYPMPMPMPMSMSMPFNQPGYMPFAPIPMPNMQQFPQGGNVPPHMMYGQFPVYYSFAPIPQQPAAPSTEENSKL